MHTPTRAQQPPPPPLSALSLLTRIHPQLPTFDVTRFPFFTIRAHAPAIESHRTLAAPTRSACLGARRGTLSTSSSPRAWVVLLPSGDVVCSPEDLPDALSSFSSSETCSASAEAAGADGGGESCVRSSTAGSEDDRAASELRSSSNALAFDHVYAGSGRGSDDDDDVDYGDGGEGQSSSPAPEATAILYGVVGSPDMMAFHRVLKAKAETREVKYAFRHALPYGREDGGGDGDEDMAATNTTPLQGYGVVLDVKNMEYQSFDSSDSEGEVCVLAWRGGGGGTLVFCLP